MKEAQIIIDIVIPDNVTKEEIREFVGFKLNLTNTPKLSNPIRIWKHLSIKDFVIRERD